MSPEQCSSGFYIDALTAREVGDERCLGRCTSHSARLVSMKYSKCWYRKLGQRKTAVSVCVVGVQDSLLEKRLKGYKRKHLRGRGINEETAPEKHLQKVHLKIHPL